MNPLDVNWAGFFYCGHCGQPAAGVTRNLEDHTALQLIPFRIIYIPLSVAHRDSGSRPPLVGLPGMTFGVIAGSLQQV